MSNKRLSTEDVLTMDMLWTTLIRIAESEKLQAAKYAEFSVKMSHLVGKAFRAMGLDGPETQLVIGLLGQDPNLSVADALEQLYEERAVS